MIPQNNLVYLPSQRRLKKQQPFGYPFLLTFWILLRASLFDLPAHDHSNAPHDLTLLPFEELVRVKVTTVSKKPEQLFDSASAVYVITGEDIRRSGYTTIAEVRGGNLLGRWTHDFSIDAQSKFQVYYDRFIRDVFAKLDIQTFDVDFQHRFAVGARHELVFGGGYRLIEDDLEASPVSSYRKEKRTLHLPSAFIQDEITLAPDLLRLTLGTKVEHHYFLSSKLLALAVKPNKEEQ